MHKTKTAMASMKADDLNRKASSSSSSKMLEKVDIDDLLPGGKMPFLPPIKLRPTPKDGTDRFQKTFLHTHRQSEKTKRLLIEIM